MATNARRAGVVAWVVAAVGVACTGGAACVAGEPGVKGGVTAKPGLKAVERGRIEATLRALPVKRAGKGDAEERAGLLEAEGVLKKLVEEMGYVVKLEPVAFRRRDEPGAAEGGPKWHNLVFEQRGTAVEGEAAREVVLVGAHYDAVPGSPGADDNGSGTAGLLEVARVLRGAPTRRTVRFVLFTLEEAGLVGSTQHVARWSEARDEAPEGDRERVAMMLSLEMIGYFKDEPGSQRNPFAALSGMVKGFSVPDRGDFIGLGTTLQHRSAVRTLAREMGKAEPGLPTLVFDHLPVAPPDLLRSDHAPYLARGLPGIIVTDTANFRNPHYHQPTDKVETLDLDRLARVTRAVAAAVWRVAGPEGEADVEWEPGAGKGAEPK